MKYLITKTLILFLILLSSNILAQNSALNTVEKDDLKGFTDASGKLVIPYMYNATYGFNEKYRIAGVRKDKGDDDFYGYIDENNKEVIPIIYSYVSDVSNSGHIIVKLNGNYGLFNNEGKELFDPSYEYMKMENGLLEIVSGGDSYFVQLTQPTREAFYENSVLTAVEKDELIGFTNSESKLVIPFMYYDTYGFNEKYRLAGVNIYTGDTDLYGYINEKNQEIIPIKFIHINKINDHGVIVVKYKNHKYGAFDTDGNLMLEGIYDKVLSITQTEAEVILNGTTQIVKIEKTIIEYVPNPIKERYNTEYIPFEENGKWGYKGKNGEVFIKPMYDKADYFETYKTTQYAIVNLGWNYGIIDKMNNEIVPLKCSEEPYVDKEGNVIVVLKGDNIGMYNIERGIIIPTIFSSISPLDDSEYYYRVETEYNNKKKIGVIDYEGNVALPIVMSYCSMSYSDKILFTIKDDKVSYHTHEGKAFKKAGQDLIDNVEITTYNGQTGKDDISYDFYDNVSAKNNAIILLNDTKGDFGIDYNGEFYILGEGEGKKIQCYLNKKMSFSLSGSGSLYTTIKTCGDIIKASDHTDK